MKQKLIDIGYSNSTGGKDSRAAIMWTESLSSDGIMWTKTLK